jgi:hypothetical protein
MQKFDRNIDFWEKRQLFSPKIVEKSPKIVEKSPKIVEKSPKILIITSTPGSFPTFQLSFPVSSRRYFSSEGYPSPFYSIVSVTSFFPGRRLLVTTELFSRVARLSSFQPKSHFG